MTWNRSYADRYLNATDGVVTNIDKVEETGKFDFGEGEVPAYIGEGTDIVIQDGVKVPESSLFLSQSAAYLIGGQDTEIGEFCMFSHSGALLHAKSREGCQFHGVNVRNAIFGRRNMLKTDEIKNCLFEDMVKIEKPFQFELCIVRQMTHIWDQTQGTVERYYGEEISPGKGESINRRKLSSKEIIDLKRRLDQQLPYAGINPFPKNLRFAISLRYRKHHPLRNSRLCVPHVGHRLKFQKDR